MGFNIQNGNLTPSTRGADHLKGKIETFAYDMLERLTSSTIAGQSPITLAYAANGNITSKTSVGTYAYNSAKIHAVQSVSNPNGTVPTGLQDISYTAYHQPSTVQEGIHKVTFTYGPDYERRKMAVEQNSVVTSTRYYFGSYEKIVSGGTTTHLHYISCGAGLVAIISRVNGADTYNYVYTDHLGSIVTPSTRGRGTVIAKQNFDAWGRSRNPNDCLPTPPAWLYRGYTGHEHLPQFNLVNMNGRMYDPVLARMLSPDNHVQAPNSTQNYNRYSYVVNNPLKYNDPDGEFILGVLINGIAAAIRGDRFFPGLGQHFENKYRIAEGLFKTDATKNTGGRIIEFISRFTWQLPQTYIGTSLANFMNNVSMVNEVNYFRGATVLDNRFEGGAFTVGSFIFGQRGFRPDFRDHLFVHEYGHYLQSQRVGLFYMNTVAWPSLSSAFIEDFGIGTHEVRWFEAHASRLAANYFDKNFGSGRAGYVFRNPNFFDVNSFVHAGLLSPYPNPRNPRFNDEGNPLVGRFHWSDIPFNLIFNGGIGLLGFRIFK